MRILTLPAAPLLRFESAGVAMDFLPAVTDGSTRVTFARIDAGGTIGAHAAPLAQAFAVVEGSGHVAVADGPRRSVGPGTLIVWEVGEVHQTWATTAMRAVIVETSGTFELSEHFVPQE
ncbi:cupin domain-containing protein [Xylanimonas ulmi]|uniref:Cupin domain n=1 Tax=Xylanimonas ulmi TaxID=228973 RepID=A0A4Q7M8C0_9MICO|nr:cupin domain-containing protein [Xylanibacterium ulmi]RZS62399.1 cupin domain [Xylanibacterium ulmi]